ncbi:MAG: group 1 truncated hemoglobin [Sulfuriflexus sp.]|nr:group 1 truncated hemoglobin [Sulfuriflexus sp.]
MAIDKTLFSRLGGKPTMMKVHKIFYDKAYAHPWLSQYFTDKPQEVLESQQTDFMTQLMGGPKIYGGKAPKWAHQHMVISDELFELRAVMLSDSIKEVGIADDLRVEWLDADAALKRSLVKPLESCSRSYPNQPILNFRRPTNC